MLRNRSDNGACGLRRFVVGQLRAGFTLVDILEDVDDDDKLGEYNIPTSILTRAVKR